MFKPMMTEDKVLEMVSKAQEFEQIKVTQTVLNHVSATALRLLSLNTAFQINCCD